MTQLFRNIVPICANWSWLWVYFVPVSRTSPLLWRHVDFRSCSLIVVPVHQCPRFPKVLKLRRAVAFACKSLKNYYGRMSNMCVQLCTHHSPCAGNRIVFASFHTCLTACGVLLVCDSETSATCGHMLWRGPIFKGNVNWCCPYEDVITVIGAAWGGVSYCLRSCMELTLWRLFFKELFTGWSFFCC